MSGGGSSTTETGPPKWMRPYYEQIAGQTMSAMNQVSRQPYQNDILAQPNAAQVEGANAALNFAGSQHGNSAPMIEEALASARGDFLAPNQYVQGAVQAAIDPLREQYFESTLPQVNDAAQMAGAWGGDRHAVAESMALEDFTENAANLASQIYYDNYTNERNNQMNAADRYMSGFEAGLAPSSAEMMLGDYIQGMDQQALCNALQLFQMNQNMPFAGLGEASSILGAGGFMSSNQSQASSPLQTAGTIASIAALAMSDRRLKKDIVPLGKKDGYNWYEYQYVFGGPRHVGVMADEVELINPGAVHTDSSGYKMVDYGAL